MSTTHESDTASGAAVEDGDIPLVYESSPTGEDERTKSDGLTIFDVIELPKKKTAKIEVW